MHQTRHHVSSVLDYLQRATDGLIKTLSLLYLMDGYVIYVVLCGTCCSKIKIKIKYTLNWLTHKVHDLKIHIFTIKINENIAYFKLQFFFKTVNRRPFKKKTPKKQLIRFMGFTFGPIQYLCKRKRGKKNSKYSGVNTAG